MAKIADNFALVRWRGLRTAFCSSSIGGRHQAGCLISPASEREQHQVARKPSTEDFELLCTDPKLYDATSGNGVLAQLPLPCISSSWN